MVNRNPKDKDDEVRRYRVLKLLPGAEYNTVLRLSTHGNLCDTAGRLIIHSEWVRDSLDKDFIEEIRGDANWWAKKGEEYYSVYLSYGIEITHPSKDTDHTNTNHYNSGNYFRSEATAQLVADFMEEALRQLHDPEWGLDENDNTKTFEMFVDARTAVLKDDGKL